MKAISCDICKKKLDDPIAGRTCFHIVHWDLCEPCKEAVELQIRPTLRNNEPFSYEMYNKLLTDTIDKATQKAKT
jgi:hypothetical protein